MTNVVDFTLHPDFKPLVGKLITPARIHAGSQIIRWRGWMTQPVDIIRHSIAMHDCLQMLHPFEYRSQAAALLHDLHETEIVGDVATPDKRVFMNDDYRDAVLRFDLELGHEAGLAYAEDHWFMDDLMKTADRTATIVENAMFTSRIDNSLPIYSHHSVWHSAMRDAYLRVLAKTSDPVGAWFQRWQALVPHIRGE